MPTEISSLWGWNGDICAVWGDAIILGETHDEKEAKAKLYAAAPDLLAALKVLTSAFMVHTQWSGEPPVEIIDACAAITKATSNI